jgi:uncharacterized membrane protein YgaE (UPF0421/DUF939 family)
MFDTMKPRRMLRDPYLDWQGGIAGARARVRGSLWAAVQASLAAALAWYVAHRLLGHPQPFFAPIAAAVAMSTNYFGRSRRAVQMIVGVLLGIGVAEVLSSLFGTSTVALGATVLLTMLVALAVGGGFVGEGMMFVNQAAASAILVVALRRHGTGAERAVDAVVGGGSALLVGVILFPAAPLPRLWAAERAVLDSLADALEHASGQLERGEPPDPAWTLSAGYDIHDKLGGLAAARGRAKANVRIAPRRWHLRPIVDAEDRRIARFDLLANAVLSLVRAMVLGLEDGQPLPGRITERIGTLTSLLRTLARTPQPWPPELVREASAAARQAIAGGPVAQVDRVPTVSAILRATGRDLAAVVDPET